MKKIVVIGAGLIGIRHVEHILAHPACELAAIVDPDPLIATKIDAPRFSSIEDVDVPVDGAIIATPTGMHLEHAKLCAERGWHMLIEKPIAETAKQAEDLVAIADHAKVQTLVGHHRRHHAKVRKLKALIENGAIGEPVTATAIWAMRKPDDYFTDNWREGPHGSPVLINLVHDIDLLRYVLGEVTQVAGLGNAPIRKQDRLENGAVVMAFDQGAVAAISFADTAPSPWGFEAGTGENPNIGATSQDMLWITGTKGGISFPSMTLWSGAKDWSEAAKPECFDAEINVPLVAQLEHFIAVMDETERPLVNAADASRTLAVALEAQSILSNATAITK